MTISQRGIYVDHEGARLVGVMFIADEGTPRPTVLVLHGVPGIEKNLDLAHALRDSGMNAVVFHYRGCWGSEGDYSVAGVPSDVRAVVDHLASGAYPEVDPEAFLLVGHSLGGWAAVMAGDHPKVKGVAALGAVVDAGSIPLDGEQVTENFTPFLKGVEPNGFMDQWAWMAEHPSQEAAARLGKPLLVIHGGKDEVVPPEQADLLFQAAKQPKALAIHPDANHAFIEHRRWLIEQIVEWSGATLD